MKLLTILLMFLLVVSSLAIDGVAGPYRLSLRTNPEVVPVGKATLELHVWDASDAPVSNATIQVLAKMPGMSMGEREEQASAGEMPGVYRVPAVFAMAGDYEVKITISGAAGSGSTILPLSTGQSSVTTASQFPRFLLLLGAGLIVAFVAWRMRSTGQKVSLTSLLNGRTLLSIALLVGALLVATWAVKSFRREGSMTPLEAQVMEMNTPAPEGVLPVSLAEAREEDFAESLRYSGQVVGYVEQDVVPRVVGTIISMPVYVGDRVKKGQLLAKLDTSQVDPMVAEKSAGVNSASQGVSVAAAEYNQALSTLTQTRAEELVSISELAEAESLLEAARASTLTAEAGVESALADVKSAIAGLSAAQASFDYQRQEIERMRALFAQGAISKDEWQRAQAETQTSEAGVTTAKENISKANALVRAAKSDLSQRRAEASASMNRVQRAKANVKSKQALTKTAQSSVASAKARIGQSSAKVAEASAGLQGAKTQKSYTELRAEVNGVITKRLISPGVVVGPGQAILQIAQVSPIRIQANVPQEELARIQVGNLVQVNSSGSSANPLSLRVTSVQPNVELSSRMGVVEVVYANSDKRFAPGQFVSVTISLGGSRRALVIPSTAVRSDGSGTAKEPSVWLAKSFMNGEFKVERVEVQIGGRAGGRTEITSGLHPGNKVVVSPYGLAGGTRVRSIERSEPSVQGPITVEVTETGYSPALVSLNANKPTKLIFIRKIENTCATSVDFPELDIHRETPLNKPITVEVPAQPAGKELTFTCPMNMYTGKAVAK